MSFWWLVLGMGAVDAAEVSWSSLAPWHTWAVVENISSEVSWFVHDDVPGPQTRCEVGVFTEAPRMSPIVWCGPAARSDAGRVPVPKTLTRVEKVAKRALVEHLAPHGEPLMNDNLEYLGTFRRVSLRQFFPVEQQSDPASSRAWGAVGQWDVDLGTGAVYGSPVPPRVRQEAVCAPGIHRGCEAPPQLLAYQPPAGWDGMLIDPRPDMPGKEARDVLAKLVAEAAAGEWTPSAARATSEGVLPVDMKAAAVVSLNVRVRYKDGTWRTTPVEVDISLNEALRGRDVARFPVKSVQAEVEVRLSLTRDYVDLRILPTGGEPIEERFGLTCAPVVDGDRAALADPCTIDTMGRWLTWEAAWGGGLQVGLEDQVRPLVTVQQPSLELP